MSCRQPIKIARNGFRFLHSTPKIFMKEECKEESSKSSCSTPGIAELPCQMRYKRKTKPLISQPQYSYFLKSMWETVPCCRVCVESLEPVRHDILYLKTVDYRERKYQRTWPACPPRCLVPKKCITEKLDIPEMERRERGKGNPNAKMCAKFHECITKEKFERPCIPDICKKRETCKQKKPTCCQKRCTLYPSYSECCAKALVPKRPTECNCLYPGGLCAVNEYAAKRGLLKVDEK